MLSMLEWFRCWNCLERDKSPVDLQNKDECHDAVPHFRSDSRTTVAEPEPETQDDETLMHLRATWLPAEDMLLNLPGADADYVESTEFDVPELSAGDLLLNSQGVDADHVESTVFDVSKLHSEAMLLNSQGAYADPVESTVFDVSKLHSEAILLNSQGAYADPVESTVLDVSKLPVEPSALDISELQADPNALDISGVQCGAVALIGRREEMEDAHTIREVNHETFLAVFDGHAGAKAAHFSRDFLYEAYVTQKRGGIPTEDALRAAIKRTEETFLQSAVAEEDTDDDCVAGTTVAVCVIDDNYKMTVANVGDTEVLWGNGDGFEVVSELHRLSNAKELERVKSVTGKATKRLEHPRFRFCSLSVTRALGDLYFKDVTYMAGKPSGLLCEPHITTVQMPPGSFVLVASDGLWDGVTKKKAHERINEGLSEGKSVGEIVDDLAHKAMKGSDDNISAILAHICLRGDT